MYACSCSCITTDKDLSAMVESPRPRLGKTEGEWEREEKRKEETTSFVSTIELVSRHIHIRPSPPCLNAGIDGGP